MSPNANKVETEEKKHLLQAGGGGGQAGGGPIMAVFVIITTTHLGDAMALHTVLSTIPISA